MLDLYAVEQPICYKILINTLKKSNLSHAYLFETNNYQKGFDMALAFAKYILCPNGYSNNSNCSNCHQCHNIENSNFLDLKIIDSEGLWIKKEQLDDLQKSFSKKSLTGNKQVYIINNAEKLNLAAANSILKFLEEPEPNIIAILVVNNKFSLLDTIISRCQIISLRNTNNLLDHKSRNEQIANYLFNNCHDINKFLDNPKSEQIISKVCEFVSYYEKNKLDTLLFSNKLWHSVIKEKEEILQAFDIMVLLYKDILNYKISNRKEIFDVEEQFNFIVENNTKEKICRKISNILKQKEKIKYNINSNLLIDSLIIEMEK